MMPKVHNTKKCIWTTHPETHPSDFPQKIWAQKLTDTKRTCAYFIGPSSKGLPESTIRGCTICSKNSSKIKKFWTIIGPIPVEYI